MNFGKGKLYCDLNDIEKSYKIANALASPVRLNILKKLVTKSMSITELSKELNVSISSISMHTALLKEAGLISVASAPGKHGTYKVCGISVDLIQFDFFASHLDCQSKTVTWNIPVGMYNEAKVVAPCGLVSPEQYIEQEDEPYVFFHPKHTQAGLIWFTTGELKYNISNKIIVKSKVKKIVISFEVCSEAPGYNINWPSDIYLKLNEKKIHTFLSTGDFGGRRGVFTPSWWQSSNTQYGELKELTVTNEGTYFNGIKVNQETITSLNLKEGYYFTFSIGVDKNSLNPGGVNLFGRNFGNFAQDIKIEIEYELS